MRTYRAPMIAVMVTLLLLGTVAMVTAEQVVSVVARVKPILTMDGLQFKDLNANGILDPYEDWRLSPEERADDLLSRMTLEEKVAQMVHLTLFNPRKEWFTNYNFGFALAYRQLEEGPAAAAKWTNTIQEWSEAARLGIPILISMDSVMGASWVRGATLFPDQIGLGATRDVELVRDLANMQREEMLAMGVRMSLSPVADLSTEPRWGRAQETFGEDAELVSAMVVAVIEGLRNGSELNPTSVLACVKHFPGAGPQQDGIDGSPLVFTKETLDYHLQPFRAAIKAGARVIMPYGYSSVPFLGGDAEERPAHESRVVMTDLLRKEMGYDGIIQTDWGMRHADAALAGADVLGGASLRDVARLAERVPVEMINESVRRILVTKFQMGLFEDPYVDPNAAEVIVGNPKHRALAREAAAASFTLLKNNGTLPISDVANIVVAGPLAADLNALNSGWKCPDQVGTTILQAIKERAGSKIAVHYLEGEEGSSDEVLKMSDIAIAVIGERAYTHEPEWGADQLDFPEEQIALLKRLHTAGLPVIAVVILGRPYVLTPILPYTDTILVVYRPGVTEGAHAIAQALFGDSPITGVLPWQLPRSMEQVVGQREDLPHDIDDPLFDSGFGLVYNPRE